MRATRLNDGSTSRSPGGAPRRPIRGKAHNSVLYRQPVTTLDDHLALGMRVEALRELVEGFEPRGEDDDAVLSARDIALRAAGPAAAVAARLLRLRGPRPDDVGASRRRGPRDLVPAADLLLQQRLGDPRPGRSDLVARRRRSELDYELEVAAVVDTPARRPPARACRGGDRRLHDLQRLVRPRPPARGDRRPARAGQGQGLRQLVRAVAGHARRTGRRPLRDRLRPRDDRRRSTAPRRAAAAGPTRSSRSARCSPAPRRTSASGRATWSAAGRSGPAACSRSATRPWAAISSRATRSSCASTDSAPSVTRSSTRGV